MNRFLTFSKKKISKVDRGKSFVIMTEYTRAAETTVMKLKAAKMPLINGDESRRPKRKIHMNLKLYC